MSEENELEIRAKEEVCVNCGYVNLVYPTVPKDSIGNISTCEENEFEEYELVRRQDVIDLIEEQVGKLKDELKELRDKEKKLERKARYAKKLKYNRRKQANKEGRLDELESLKSEIGVEDE